MVLLRLHGGELLMDQELFYVIAYASEDGEDIIGYLSEESDMVFDLNSEGIFVAERREFAAAKLTEYKASCEWLGEDEEPMKIIRVHREHLRR
jgi:hypothetical protein